MTLCWFFSRKDPFQLCLCYSEYFDMWLSMFSSLTVADTRQCRLVHHSRQYFLAVNGCVVSPLCSWSRLVLGHLAQIWCINPGDMWCKLTSPLCSNMAPETLCVLVELPNPVLLYGIATPGKLLFQSFPCFLGVQNHVLIISDSWVVLPGTASTNGRHGRASRSASKGVCSLGPKIECKTRQWPRFGGSYGPMGTQVGQAGMGQNGESLWVSNMAHMDIWRDELMNINYFTLKFTCFFSRFWGEWGTWILNTQISKQRMVNKWPWSNRIQAPPKSTAAEGCEDWDNQLAFDNRI